ncbi:MAG: O-antigen ligase [Flavobacterium sp.]|nr:O-antigen ligase [Flavobacterium sp.]
MINFIFDIICLVFSAYLLRKDINFFHPMFFYLFFHIYSFSYRYLEVKFLGGDILYQNSIYLQAVSLSELNKGLFWADISLLFFSFGCILSNKIKIKEFKDLNLCKDKVIISALIFFLIGVPFFLITRDVDFSQDGFNIFIKILSLWPIISICLLIYYYGFKWYYIALLLPFYILIALQGYNRFMIILPTIFLIMTYLMQKKNKWPDFKIIIFLVSLVFIFPQLKYIGMSFYSNNTLSISERLISSYKNVSENDLKSESAFLDLFSSTMTMADEKSILYLGVTYLKIPTIFIPRFLWSEKPGLADHIKEISNDNRPFDIEGRIITYLGEAYINFSYLGLISVPFILGFLLTLFYKKFFSFKNKNLYSYVYLAFIISLIQVFRDGLASFIVFGLFQNFLMIFVFCWHKFSWSKR